MSVVVLALIFPQSTRALTNNLALTPPMGWNDWNNYGCGISESIVTNNAGVIATNGMKSAGYQFVNIDDCWQISRGADGVIVPDPTKFPHGIPWLAGYVHGLGLKLGVYSDHGTATCQGKPGGYGYEYVDANTYAQWGADYLKYDNCNVPGGATGQVDYGRMSDGLLRSGRPLTFSICGANGNNNKGFCSWSPVFGNLWRTTSDINDTYTTMISHLDSNSQTAYAAGPGRWNDPDMLEVGRGGMTTNQDQTHFTMWCIMAAPLIMGNNLTSMSAQALATLTNPEAIAVDQDPAGEEGIKVVNNPGSTGTNEVWSKTLGYDFSTKAVALLNRWGPPTNITCYWTNLGLQAGSATVRDLLAHADLGTFTNSFTATVASNSAMLLKIVGTPPALPAPGTNFLNNLQAVYAYTGFGTIVKNKSIGGNTITLGGVPYTNGIGVNSYSGIEYDLGGICSRFQTTIGVDADVSSSGSVIFQVFADGTKIYDSGVMVSGSAPQVLNLDVTGVSRLVLGVGDADDNINFDHADWANALVIVTNTTPQPPGAPTGLVANAGNPVTLAWNATVSATNYNVKRSLSGSGPFTPVGTSQAAGFSDAGVTTGTTYYYVVSAVDSIGEGSNSAPAGVTACSLPSVATNLTTSTTTSNAMVTWNAVAGATGYTVARALSGTPYTTLATGVTATNYNDTSVTPGTVYYYVVTASNACNQGPTSAYVAAIVPSAPVGPPQLWNGASPSDSDWSDPANWGGSNLVAHANLVFDGNARLNNTNDTASGTVYSNILFNPGAGAFVLNGNPITLSSTVTNNSSHTETVSLGINFSNNLFFTGTSGTLVVGGGLTSTLGSGSTTNTLAGSGQLSNLLAVANNPGGTNLVAMNGAGDNWTLLDNPASTLVTVPWVLAINNGTFNFGTASSAPKLTSTTPNGQPSDFVVGTLATGTGTFTMNNGTFTTSARLDTGASVSGATGIVNQTGGTLTVGNQIQGANIGGGTSMITISGGTLNVGTAANPSSTFYVASRGTGTLTISGLAAVNCGTVDVSRTIVNGTAGTVNLNGGTLACGSINTATANSTSPSSASTANFNFNGGTLTPRGSSTAFMTDSSTQPVPLTVTVKAGGAIIDDAGFNISILESLQHDSTLGSAPDGGLVKNGSGRVTFTKAGTYTGNTTINAGTLVLSNTAALTTSPLITVAAGATLDATGRADQTLTLAGGETLNGLGTLNGNVIFSGGATLAPGNPVGTLTFNNNLTLNGGSTAIRGINKAASPSNDLAQVTGSVNLAGTLLVTNFGATALAAGDSFRLFSASSYSGGFTNLLPVTPGSGLAWDTSGLNTNGMLRVVTAPRPHIGAATLTGGGLVISGTGGVPYAGYYVLASTNAALPTAQWIRIATNQLDSGGNFLFTNAINASTPRRFYLLELQ